MTTSYALNAVPESRYKGPIMPAIDQYGNRSWSGQHEIEDVRRYGRMRDCVKELVSRKPTPEEPAWTQKAAWVFVFQIEFGKDPTPTQAKPIWTN